MCDTMVIYRVSSGRSYLMRVPVPWDYRRTDLAAVRRAVAKWRGEHALTLPETFALESVFAARDNKDSYCGYTVLKVTLEERKVETVEFVEVLV